MGTEHEGVVELLRRSSSGTEQATAAMTPLHPRIFYHAYSHQYPTGGQKCVYAHVQTLAHNGVEAYVYHEAESYRLTWFENTAPVVGPLEFRRKFDPARDYLVLPEDLGSGISTYPGRKVIFNKGLYNGFRVLGQNASIEYPWERQDVVAVFCVSRHNEIHLRAAFPNLRIFVIPPAIRWDLFRPRPLAEKLPIVCAAPKNAGQILSVFHCLNGRMRRRRGTDYSWRFVEGLSESETAELLRAALIFVFLSIEEGLPRMVMEAVASGCIVIAYRGGPLGDLLPDEFLFEYGNHTAVVDFLEQALLAAPGDRGAWAHRVGAARQCLQSYTTESCEASLLHAWNAITQGSLRG